MSVGLRPTSDITGQNELILHLDNVRDCKHVKSIFISAK
jgi:hypothetical protein